MLCDKRWGVCACGAEASFFSPNKRHTYHELLEAAKETIADYRSACRRQGLSRTAPSAASHRRLGVPCCPAPARPPPNRPIMAFSLRLGALRELSKSDLTKTSTLHTGLWLVITSRFKTEIRWFGCPRSSRLALSQRRGLECASFPLRASAGSKIDFLVRARLFFFFFYHGIA